MKTIYAITLALGSAAVLATATHGQTTKMTGGGKAIGDVWVNDIWDFESGGPIPEFDPTPDETLVPATIAGEVWYQPSETQDGYVGGGNLQFVDHLTGECFHVEILSAGPSPNEDYDVLAIGATRACGPGEGEPADFLLLADIWLADGGVQGPNKQDSVLILKQRYNPQTESDYLGYVFKGELKGGNLKLHLPKAK